MWKFLVTEKKNIRQKKIPGVLKRQKKCVGNKNLDIFRPPPKKKFYVFFPILN